MHRYGATREALALNSRHNANLNPRAFFYSEPMSREDYFNSRVTS
jgi:acetyl-CoA acetyltransferase